MDHINQIVGQIRGRSPKIAATNRAQSARTIIAYYCLLGVDEPVFQIQGREKKNPVTSYTAKPTSLEHLELETTDEASMADIAGSAPGKDLQAKATDIVRETKKLWRVILFEQTKKH